MDAVQIEQGDERDGGWEDLRPRFRVYLHGSASDSPGGSTDTYDVTGADVLQTIEWAQRQAGDSRTYAIALVYDDEAEERRNPGFGRGLVWLVGADRNDIGVDSPAADRQERMLAKQTDPVAVPVADQMLPDVLDPYNADS